MCLLGDWVYSMKWIDYDSINNQFSKGLAFHLYFPP